MQEGDEGRRQTLASTGFPRSDEEQIVLLFAFFETFLLASGRNGGKFDEHALWRWKRVLVREILSAFTEFL